MAVGSVKRKGKAKDAQIEAKDQRWHCRNRITLVFGSNDIEELDTYVYTPKGIEFKTVQFHQAKSKAIEEIGFPIVMKVVGPVHKSDVGGVSLNIEDFKHAVSEFNRMMDIADAHAVLLQPMAKGIELFAGLKREGSFGHMLLFGLGGIFIEVFKDVRTLMVPVATKSPPPSKPP